MFFHGRCHWFSSGNRIRLILSSAIMPLVWKTYAFCIDLVWIVFGCSDPVPFISWIIFIDRLQVGLFICSSALTSFLKSMRSFHQLLFGHCKWRTGFSALSRHCSLGHSIWSYTRSQISSSSLTLYQILSSEKILLRQRFLYLIEFPSWKMCNNRK